MKGRQFNEIPSETNFSLWQGRRGGNGSVIESRATAVIGPRRCYRYTRIADYQFSKSIPDFQLSSSIDLIYNFNEFFNFLNF
jgi:hypothetical protein